VKAPLQKMDIRSVSLTTFKPLGGLLRVPTAIIGSRSGKRQDELRMNLGGTIDAIVGFNGNDGAKRERIRSVTKAPNKFKLFLWKVGDFG
jgi:hypothetical protein